MTKLLAPAALVAVISTALAAEEWPQWRGPRGDGVSAESVSARWPRNGPKRLWSARVGVGHSSPVVAAGRVYLFHLQNNRDTLTCFDAATGKVAWSNAATPGWNVSGKYPGSRATPTIERDRIYTYGGSGDLISWNLASGKPLWHLNVLRETGSQPLAWGQASSPAVFGDRVVVQAGIGGPVAVAVDKNTGRLAWRAERGLAGYATAVGAEVEGEPLLLVFGGDALWGLDPRTGKTRWKAPWPTEYDVNAATPIYHDGRVFVTSAYNRPAARCAQFQIMKAGVKEVWENHNLTCRFQPPVLDNGYLYGNSEGTIRCLDWQTGKVQWEGRDRDLRIGMGGSLLRLGSDQLLAMSDRGALVLMQATPRGVKPLARAQVFDARDLWSTPVVYDGRLYARGTEEFACFDVRGQ